MSSSIAGTQRGALRRIRHWRRALVERARDLLALAGGRWRRPPHRLTHQAGGPDGHRHILMVDDLLPDPLFGAGYPRAFAIVQALVRAGHRVDFYPMESTPGDLARMAEQFAGVRFHRGEGARGLRRLLWRQGSAYDVLFVSRPRPMQAFVDARWRPRGAAPRIVYDAEAVLSPREARRRALFGPAWSAEEQDRALRDELGLAQGAELVTAVSEADAGRIASVLDVPVFVLPHPVAARAGGPGFADRRDLLFVGRLTGASSISPNVDSMTWFLAEVMPVLDTMIGGDWRLHVAGLIDTPELAPARLDPARVVLHGVVPDLAPLYDRCRVFVAPTRYAAGIPLKVVEAMGEGIPCVVTPLLAEQLAMPDLPAGGTAADFAAQCARLYTDPDAWGRVRNAGAAHVARHYSHGSFDHVLAQLLARR